MSRNLTNQYVLVQRVITIGCPPSIPLKPITPTVIVSATIVLVMLISLVLKLKNLEPVTIRDKIKILLYIFASLTVYFAVVPGAYYLTF